MKDLHMVDLRTQYIKIKDEIDNAILEVINQTKFINGPAVKELQLGLEKYLDLNNAITCANGTDALQIALMALDLEPGDEVITPDFTFISTVEVVELLGLKSVLVDVDKDSFNINPEAIRKAITQKTRAIIPVHLYGQCAHMEEINKIANENNLYVIEDMAQAIGTEYFYSNGEKKYAGNLGNIACTSFFPSKNLGCYGDGGALFTNDDKLANKIRLISNHGARKKYHHSKIGVNSRLDTIQAAILNIKLKYLNNYNNSRIKAASLYDSYLKDIPGISIPHRNKFSSHCFHQYTIKCNNLNRSELQEYLRENDIPSMIYYPVPLHKQEVFKDRKFNEGDFKISNSLCEQVLSLPIHTELEEEQIDFICRKVIDFANND